MKKITAFLGLLLSLGALISGCTSGIVKEVNYAPSPAINAEATPTPIIFKGLELLLPPGAMLGNKRGGFFCASPSIPVNRNVLAKEIDEKFLRQNFHDALEANGYDVTGSLNVIFNPEDEEQRAEYSIRGTLKDVQLDMCDYEDSRKDWLTMMPGESGRMYLAIDWSVYDILRQTVVYKTKTEGYTKRRIPNTEGMALLFHDAFEMAAHNLAAEENFRALIFENVKPDKAENGLDWRGEKIDARPMLFDSDEDVNLISKPLSLQPLAKNMTPAQNMAVIVKKSGHGSGFFITPQGHILTNASIVGEARKVRIVTNFRKTGITAEVLRLNRARDVALLKLEEIPDWLKKEGIQTAPLRLDWPSVGEDVYAIGAPHNDKYLKSTVSKGIVSAHRRNFKHFGVRQNFIQSDVEVHSGSAGGPFFDEYGNLIGLSNQGFKNDDSSFGNGLNLFIPIREALDTLGIAY